jgi:hypothetical protein
MAMKRRADAATTLGRLFACSFFPAHKPVDAGANQDYRKASTCERTRGSANLPKVISIVSVVVPKVISVVGRRGNAQCERQRHRESQRDFHHHFPIMLIRAPTVNSLSRLSNYKLN